MGTIAGARIPSTCINLLLTENLTYLRSSNSAKTGQTNYPDSPLLGGKVKQIGCDVIIASQRPLSSKAGQELAWIFGFADSSVGLPDRSVVVPYLSAWPIIDRGAAYRLPPLSLPRVKGRGCGDTWPRNWRAEVRQRREIFTRHCGINVCRSGLVTLCPISRASLQNCRFMTRLRLYESETSFKRP